LAGPVTAVLYEEMEEHLDLRSRLAEGDFKPPRGALAEDRRLERRGKRRDLIASGAGREDEREVVLSPLPFEASKIIEMASKPGRPISPGMSLGVIRLLPRWCPA
jgi:hypothetical protein